MRPNGTVRASQGELHSARRVAITALASIGALGFAVLIRLPLFNSPAPAQDEGELLLYPTLIHAGAVAHRDFQTFYGPAEFWTLAGAYWVAGADVWVERTCGLALHLMLASGVAAITWRFGRTTALIAGSLTALILWPLGLVAYAWLAALALTVWSLVVLERATSSTRTRGALIAGALLGSAGLFRPDILPAAILTSVVWLAQLDGRTRGRWCIGLLLGSAPWVGHAFAAGFEPLWRNLIVEPIFTTAAGRSLPLPSPGQPAFGLMWFTLIATGAALAANLVGLRGRMSRDQTRLRLGLTVLGIGLLPQMFKRPDLAHIVYTASVAIPLGVVAAAAERWRPTIGVPALLSIVTICLLGIESQTLLVPWARELHRFREAMSSGAVWVHHDGRRYPAFDTAAATAINQTLAEIDTRTVRGDRVIVLPRRIESVDYNDTFLYFLLPNRRPGTYYLEMEPQTADGDDSRLPQELARADLVVLDRALDNPLRSAPGGAGGTRVRKALNDRFCLASTHGTFEIYVPCGLMHPA